VPASRSSEAGAPHSTSASDSSALKPSRRRARSISSGPHGHRIGIQLEGSTLLLRPHHVTPDPGADQGVASRATGSGRREARMRRREAFRLAASGPVAGLLSARAAQAEARVERAVRGLPSPKITDVKAIATRPPGCGSWW
jgi:hypothetical protein